jgi:hypothetical protein
MWLLRPNPPDVSVPREREVHCRDEPISGSHIHSAIRTRIVDREGQELPGMMHLVMPAFGGLKRLRSREPGR